MHLWGRFFVDYKPPGAVPCVLKTYLITFLGHCFVKERYGNECAVLKNKNLTLPLSVFVYGTAGFIKILPSCFTPAFLNLFRLRRATQQNLFVPVLRLKYLKEKCYFASK